MQKQTLAIAVETKNGIVQRIGKSAIFTPKPNFGGEASSGMWTGPKRKRGNQGRADGSIV